MFAGPTAAAAADPASARLDDPDEPEAAAAAAAAAATSATELELFTNVTVAGMVAVVPLVETVTGISCGWCCDCDCCCADVDGSSGLVSSRRAKLIPEGIVTGEFIVSIAIKDVCEIISTN